MTAAPNGDWSGEWKENAGVLEVNILKDSKKRKDVEFFSFNVISPNGKTTTHLCMTDNLKAILRESGLDERFFHFEGEDMILDLSQKGVYCEVGPNKLKILAPEGVAEKKKKKKKELDPA